MSYEAWRITYQSSEQAARAAYNECQQMKEELRIIRGQTLTTEEYNARAKPRLEAIDQLSKKIDFSTDLWKWTPEGERYQRLMNEQGADEIAAGL
jgi:hypothetical protein